MKNNIHQNAKVALLLIIMLVTGLKVNAISLWVGESYTWDFSGSVLGSTYNMNVTTSGGYLSVTGSGFYRKITPTQYFSGTATVKAEWDYTLYYGARKQHQRVTVSITCRDNQVSIRPTSIELSPGQTYQLGYSHQFNNQYESYSNAHFSGGNTSFTVTSSGLITAKSPGSGYVNVYSKVSSVSPYCKVTVKEVSPTGAYTNNYSVYADQSIDLNATVSPSNATVKSKQWIVKSGNDIVSISGSRLVGLKPGTATIYCLVNGSIRSNDATVSVLEPSLIKSSVFPSEGSTGISVFVNPSVTYSHVITKGDAFNSISLSDGTDNMNGTVEINGRELRFLPSSFLNPLTKYTLHIPKNAVKNKWGSSAQTDVLLSFSTADLEKASVVISPSSGSFLTSTDYITLSPTPSDAKIYYTIDGSVPTTESRLYTEPFHINTDMTIKVIAVRDGYKNSDVVSGQYKKSQAEIVSYYPKSQSPLFNYSMVCPSLMLSGSIEASYNFDRISLTTASGENVTGEILHTNDMITFVPDEPLRNSTTYTINIPRDAVRMSNGEVFKGFSWVFTTPTLPVQIGLQGDESVYLLSEDGKMKTRGMDYLTVNSSNGSFTYKDYGTLTNQLEGVSDFACGYTHRLIKKGTSVTGYGMALCGETGSSSIASIGEAKLIKAGFQTSAIISQDNSLWMCGRNDFYQLGDGTGTTSKSFVKVADNIIDVALGNSFTLFVDTDNVLWAVGRNHKGQLGDGTTIDRHTPVKVMDGVSKVFASTTGFFSACVTLDGKLFTWGDNTFWQLGREIKDFSSTPSAVMNDVCSVALGEAHVLAITNDSKLYSWGSNSSNQIGGSQSIIRKPSLMQENVRAIAAGPNSSLILSISGKVVGYGHKSHSNFGEGDGDAKDYVINEGYICRTLLGVILEPNVFEVEPESRFALLSKPVPLTADYDTVLWESDHPEVAQVYGNGVVSTKNIGEATITARYIDRYGLAKSTVSKIVCTDNPINSIYSPSSNSESWNVRANKHTVIVENANIGVTYTIYNLQGFVIDQCEAKTNKIIFNVNTPGIYLVKSGDKVIKTTCH